MNLPSVPANPIFALDNLPHLRYTLAPSAGVAQSVERQLPKLKVAGSIPVSRLQNPPPLQIYKILKIPIRLHNAAIPNVLKPRILRRNDGDSIPLLPPFLLPPPFPLPFPPLSFFLLLRRDS